MTGLGSEDIEPIQPNQSRVVTFEQKDKFIALIDASKTNKLIANLEQQIILARFPITKTDDQSITFEFNDHIGNTIVVAADGKVDGWELHNPMVEKVEFISENAARIQQVANVIQKDKKASIQIQYLIAPYMPDPSYKMMTEVPDGKTHFFSWSEVTTNDGPNIKPISRFHPEKTISVKIGKTVPTAYREAVKEGLLYWNKSFGTEKVKVLDPGFDPSAVVENDPAGVSVEWLASSKINFAYGQATVDPRTGQTLSGAIVIPQGFASIFSEQHFKLMLNQAHAPQDLNVATATEDFNKDRIRGTIAHELGHILGLRHNFAASTVSNLNEKTMHEAFIKSIVDRKSTPLSIVSSSVMDYLPQSGREILSRQISELPEPLPYDKAAIKALYQQDFADLKLHIFCTDNQVGYIVDCQRHDIGLGMPDQMADDYEHQLQEFRNAFIVDIFNAKDPKKNPSNKPITTVSAGKEYLSASTLPMNGKSIIFSPFSALSWILLLLVLILLIELTPTIEATESGQFWTEHSLTRCSISIGLILSE